MKCLIALFVVGCIALAMAGPLQSEMKEYDEKLKQARHEIELARTMLKSDYIEQFGAILEKGVNDLDANTKEQLKTTTDAAKRQELITYAIKAYDRLIKFLIEIKKTIQ
ncbi:hypothetical protein BLOT_000601 [Blomia tropicalis]|nr:hypothetical protein BLOT_000601 [Blomia tropicalis]